MKNVLIIVFFLLSPCIEATVYYIDPSGSNSNSGSSSSPWETLSYACYRVATPGDIIHVNAGIYYETAQSVLATGVSIEGEGNNSVIRSYVTSASTFTILLSSASQGTNGNQSISKIRMEGGMSAYGAILVDKRSNVTIHHCEFEDFFTRGVTFTGSGYYSDIVPSDYAIGNSFHDNAIVNCSDYAGSGHYGSGYGNLEIGGQEGMLVYNNNIIQEDRGPDSNGFCIKYANDGYCKGLKIFNNTIIKPPYDGSTWDFSIELWNCRGGIEIFENNIQGSIDFGGHTSLTNDAGGYGFAIKVYNNTIGQETLRTHEENGIDLERGHTGGIYIYNNLFRNLTSALVMYQGNNDVFEDMYVYYNVFTNLGASNQSNFGNGIDWQTIDVANITYDNINFLNNTIIAGTGGDPQSGLRFNFHGDATNINIRNNIITGFSASPVYFESYSSIANLSIENNIFYDNGNWNQPKYSYVTPVNNTTENNIISDPLFESLTDYHLQAESPAIGKGLWIQGLSSDFEGNATKDPPSLGAYEYYPPVPPQYQYAMIENDSPSLLVIVFDQNLANVIPPSTAFSIMINSQESSAVSVSVVSNKVLLSLPSEVVYGDTVTVAYSQPENNPLQTPRGALAPSISSKSVSLEAGGAQEAPVVLIDYPDTEYGGFIGELDASSSYDPASNPITAEWIVPANVPVSGTTDLNIKFLAPVVDKPTVMALKLNVSNGTDITSKDISITILPYHPELFAAQIIDIEASNFILPNIPAFASDGNQETFWSSDGDNQWLQFKLSKPSKISYIQLDFLREQDYASYFDIYASQDYITWDPVLIGAVSCGFSGESQIFDFPSEYIDTAYLYLKYIGHGTTVNSLNSISEFKAFGPDTSRVVVDNKLQIKIYPNPARDMINISIIDPGLDPDRLIIADLSGKIVVDEDLITGNSNLQIPLNLKSGLYIVELLSRNLILITQKIIVIPNKGL